MNNISDTKESLGNKIISGIKRSIPEIIGMIAGGIGGYFYYSFVGCSGGTCPITSNPWLTILWGSVTGYLIGSIFHSKNNKNNKS
jgi:hypothetical protein